MNQESLFDNMLDSLLKRFEDIHNHLYANDGLSEQQVLEEIVKILFMKYFDEQSDRQLFYILDDEQLKIHSSKNQDSFLERINKLFEETKQKYASFFDDEDRLMLSPQSLIYVIKKLQKINFIDSSKDANGLAFQKFLGRHAKGGRGQFFTPDPVIDFCVEIINPKPDEKIIDPACGTAGFLFSSLRYIIENYKGVNIQNYVNKNIFGIEINKRISQIAKIKFLLECNTDPNIICCNALIDTTELSAKFNRYFDIIDIKNYFDVILTNPPFGTQGRINDNNLLSKYELGYKWCKVDKKYIKSNTILKGQVPEILFIERCLQLLRPGGRLGIVLPNGQFENSSLEYLRKFITNIANILGIILLPQETFIPYGTGVKASLLFLQKKNGDIINNKRVFFSKIGKTGYAGNKNGSPIYKKDVFGNVLRENGKKIIDEDFSEVLTDYKEFLKEYYIKTNKSFSINSEKLDIRFDYDYYSPENMDLISILKKLNSQKICDIAEIVHTKPKFENRNEVVEYIELSDIYTKSFEIVNSTTLNINDLPSRASYKLKTGDIITAVAGNSIGTVKHATAYVTEEFNGAICTNGFRVLRNYSINPFYLLYYFQSDLFLKQVYMYRTGAAIPAISDNDFGRILIYLPPQNEIENISSYLEKGFSLREMAKKEFERIKSAISVEQISNLSVL